MNQPKPSENSQSTDPASLELAGDQASAGGNPSEAISCYRAAIKSSQAPSKMLFDKLGQQWMNAGRPFDAVATLKEAISRHSNDVDLRMKVVGVLSSLGMQQEAGEHLQWLIQRGHGDLGLLSISADLTRPQTVESTCKFALTHNPDDLRPQFSIAALRAYYGKWQEVVDLLRPVANAHPDFMPAQALYLRALVELGKDLEVTTLANSLPKEIRSSPQYWFAAGIWAQRHHQVESAANAFWRCVQLDENNGEALLQLSASLAEVGRMEESRSAAKRATSITSVRDGIDALRTWRNNSQVGAVKVAESLHELGRLWEATTWLQLAFAMDRNPDPQLADKYKAVRAELTGATPWQLRGKLVAAKLDLSMLAEVDWQGSPSTAPASIIASSKLPIRFSEQARQRGLNHLCDIGKTSTKEAGLTIYQSGAGGAAVIDFDSDGWPDVYLTSMTGQPLKDDSAPNHLYRNCDGKFVDMTTLSAAGDLGFSQGVCSGDYNSDGWPDLLVANIGLTRLYRNNGDGTFTDATELSGLSGNKWTSSVAIADINGDGHADIFEVGYCAGDLVFEQRCMDDEVGHPRSCSPLAFEAQPDRVWKGLGDGRFSDATHQWLSAHEAGRGLGVVVGQLDSSPGLDVYIANDMTPNHYWTLPMADDSETSSGDLFRLSEQASLRGLAVNERSLSQASMGIAAADADRDGDLDFLLTHFSNDYNTFYEQTSPGLWADRSRRVGLAEPSLEMLGYGTQFIDCDNDGAPELLVANGDIDDFSHKGRAFRQPPQLFQRSEEGEWKELASNDLGDYFSSKHLGRAVVTLDVNRDARTDVLITHLFEPTSVLVNETNNAGNSVRLFLRGTTSHRDAIGARVTLETGKKSFTHFLNAGNGYQCSTERCLSIGIGDATQVERLVVDWPNGEAQVFRQIKTNQDYLIVEGTDDVFEWVR